MMITRRHGFTLIELLIVVAIIAITVAASMTVVTGPMMENIRAQDDEAFEAGTGVLFARLAQDAHNCTSLDATSGSLTLNDVGHSSGNVVYAVNSSGTLTRKSTDQRQVVNLVSNVTSFSADRLATASLYTVSLESRIRGYKYKPAILRRKMDVLVGRTGGAL